MSKQTGEAFHKSFVSSGGESLHLYALKELTERDADIVMKFCRVDQPLIAFRGVVSREILKNKDITIKDLQKAPAFVVRFYEDHRLVEFISARKRKIDSLKIAKLAR